MLTYIGPRLSTGEPERNLALDGIPQGDVDEATLTDEQIDIALKSGLYKQATPKPPKAKE